jgi:hypothetical protein
MFQTNLFWVKNCLFLSNYVCHMINLRIEINDSLYDKYEAIIIFS